MLRQRRAREYDRDAESRPQRRRRMYRDAPPTSSDQAREPTESSSHDAPPADGNRSDIQRYIVSKSRCFYHARGQPCPRMVEVGNCKYRHMDSPIAFGAYKRPEHGPNLGAFIASEQSAYYDDLFALEVSGTAQPASPTAPAPAST